ncbi:MAG: creatininase family protein [Erysipelotrichales bacterium]|nr:creatininase family protein [Erysipelotrichales bacterium]
MRTRILPKMLNSEVEAYLEHNDIIIVPVGTVEMHGGLPLDCETVISEAFALKMAEACDGLVLTGLPYFYAGATASGRGTTQVSVRQGIDYLGAIARSLLRQGFKRQIYISLHGPAHMTCSPMVRDFFDETGVPILYMDMMMQMQGSAKDIISMEEVKQNPRAFMEKLDSMFVGAYDILGRLEDVPVTSEFYHTEGQTVAAFDPMFKLAYQSGSVGYCFGDPKDHASTTAIKSEEHRKEMAEQGKVMIDKMVANMNMPKVVEDLKNLKAFEDKIMEKYPWMPAAYNSK